MRMILPFALLSALLGSAAIAAPIVFDATGTFDNGSTLGGTVVIDTATGIVTSADLTVSGIATHFTTIFVQDDWPTVSPFLTRLQLLNGQAADNFLTFLFPPVSLVGYTGGILCDSSNSAACAGGGNDFHSNYSTRMPNGNVSADTIVMLASGALTAEAVPEPSSFVLLSLGVAALLGVRRATLSRQQF